MKSRYKNMGFGLLLLFAANTFAQEKVQSIDLETALRLGGANNFTIKEYKARQQLATADLQRAREWWLPKLYAGATLHQLWGAAMNTDGIIFSDLNRQNFWGGLGINASWDLGESIYSAKAANLEAKAGRLLTQAKQNQALLAVIETYYDFLTGQLKYRAYEQLAMQADSIAQQLKVLADAQLTYQSDYLLASSNHKHLRIAMLNAKTDYLVKAAELAALLNLEPGVKLAAKDQVLAPLLLMTNAATVGVTDSVYQNRPEISYMNLRLQSLETKKKTVTTGTLLPQLRVGTYTSMFGDVFTPLYPTSAINASLLWHIPTGRLFYGGEKKQYNARIGLQQIDLDKAKAQVIEEVSSARVRVMLANEQMELAKASNELAGQALQQSMQRQQLGTMRPMEILQAQEIYIQARLDYLESVSRYNKAQYRLYVATGQNL